MRGGVGNYWDDIESGAAVFDETGAVRAGFTLHRAGLGIRPQRSARSRETREARRAQRPMECPKCGTKFSRRGVGPHRGVSKIWLAGWNKGSERPRYKCSVCEKKFSWNYAIEFPRLKIVKAHGRSRYQKHGCRCEVCVAAIRQVWRRKYARRRSRLSDASPSFKKPNAREKVTLNHPKTAVREKVKRNEIHIDNPQAST